MGWPGILKNSPPAANMHNWKWRPGRISPGSGANPTPLPPGAGENSNSYEMSKLLIIGMITLLHCSPTTTVYLCNGPQSKVYHKIKSCPMLKKCSTAIEAVDLATAKARKRRECGRCWR